jgi:hypothetical protein
VGTRQNRCVRVSAPFPFQIGDQRRLDDLLMAGVPVEREPTEALIPLLR